jgi:hypothetical protein
MSSEQPRNGERGSYVYVRQQLGLADISTTLEKAIRRHNQTLWKIYSKPEAAL